jgi:hypothetical protein
MLISLSPKPSKSRRREQPTLHPVGPVGDDRVAPARRSQAVFQIGESLGVPRNWKGTIIVVSSAAARVAAVGVAVFSRLVGHATLTLRHAVIHVAQVSQQVRPDGVPAKLLTRQRAGGSEIVHVAAEDFRSGMDERFGS